MRLDSQLSVIKFSALTILSAILLASLLPVYVCRAADLPKPQTALAMSGAPQFPDGLTSFPYVNPAAPKDGTLKLAATGAFDSLNPFIVRGQPPLGLGTGFMALVYEPLMARSWDEPFTLYGLIAKTVEVAADRSSIIFNLNPKAHFSDGQLVTADDVIFSYETLRDQGRPNHRTYYKKVASVEKLSPQRVKFTFKPGADGRIDREMPLIMGLMPILPKQDWQDRDFNQTTWRVPVGSGPYRITAVDPGRAITYKRDPDYWGHDLPVQRGLYNFDTIHIDYYRDDGIALQAFKAGQFDLRHEMDPNKWATAYDFPAVRDGRVKLEQLPHHRTEPAYGFVFNTRRAPFNDPAFRAALEYSFDFEWINRVLFHGQYHRMNSFFPNSELAAPPLPDAAETAILDKYRDKLPATIFTAPVATPATDGREDGLRDNLLKAEQLLRQAGYRLQGDRLVTPDNQPVAFEILLSDPMEEKVALTWLRALNRLGIAARVHTVDSAQFQKRQASFDYDVTSAKWFNSLSPGNEQVYFWGSAAAGQQGSRNYPGIADPVVDALAAAIPAAQTRDELVVLTHALDRVLISGHYLIPLYYLGVDDYAWWTAHLRHPAIMPAYGSVLESWWAE
jgi:microcin C transport system substrate-binding protein